MMINNLNKKYHLIRKLKSNSYMDIYLCKQIINNVEGNQYYTLIQIKDQQIQKECISYFSDHNLFENLLELIDYFQYNNSIYVVFVKCEGELLQKEIGENKYDLFEKLQISQKIFEKVILYGDLYYLLYDALQPSTMTISKSLDIDFHYQLEHIENAHIYTINHVMECLYQWLCFLFKEEIKNGISLELKKFIKNIQNKTYDNYFDMYQEYMGIKNEMEILLEEGELKPVTIFFKIWAVMKKSINLLKVFFIMIILAGALGYVIWELSNRNQSGYEDIFNHIGTVEIDKGEDEE